ncbi:LLM class flavin-dependent oxidoreductase [Actinopolymorpha alba]|uniref:LLM class flavin-dependent oxidoreductase n=1 Tax=Actinopolymorpha alba TaxID=533267 RepID=UPI000477BFB8|nr:LLM class flavin-dependent oxidoreductase [Actinopolymorpha alba]
MKLGLNVPAVGDPAFLVDLAVTAEATGWDGFFLWDHLHRGSNRPELHDPWSLIGAFATRTSRLRLGTLVTPVARRRPWQLAKQVTTIDHLSNGRVTLGVGLGAPADLEYAAFGESDSARVHAAMLDEALPLIDAFLRGEAVSHTGEYFRVSAQLAPAAVQKPRPPIWVAGSVPHRRPMQRALRWDGFYPLDPRAPEGGLRPEVLAEVVERLDPPEGFEIITALNSTSSIDALEKAGATWVIDEPSDINEPLTVIQRRIEAGPPR